MKVFLSYTVLLLSLFASHILMAYDVHNLEFHSEVQQKRFQSLITELRCPKCQNQSLADSDSEIAQDLKLRVYELLMDERSDDEIRNFLIDR